MTRELRQVETPLGPISYVLTIKNVKNYNLRLGHDGSVGLSAGHWVTRKAADDFIRRRAEWIDSRRSALSQRQTTVLTPPDPGKAAPILEASLMRMWQLTEPLGVKPPQLHTRFMTSRWGSCHWQKGAVTLNTALSLVPEELLDYVSLHELIHFLHPNHGPQFYRTLGSLMPDWAERRRQLRSYELRKSAAVDPGHK